MPLPHAGSETLASTLAHHAGARPEAPFVVFEPEHGDVVVRSYLDVYRRALGVAHRLRALEARRVHLHLRNDPEFFSWWFGASLAGAAIVPTDPRFTVDEIAYVVGHARCEVSVTHADLRDAVAAAQGTARVLAADDIEPADAPPGGVDPRPGDLAAVLYTSGTTSRPKGVLVTHANYLYAGEVVAQHLRVRPDDRWLVVLPLFHANAQYYATMSALVSGASLAVVERFSASRWSAQAVRHHATLASLFAAPIRMILARPPGDHDARNRLRAVIFSQNVTEAQLDDFEARFGTVLVQLYGMTETIAPPLVNPLFGERRNLSLGRPTLGARVRVVNGSGREAAVGEIGELLVAGEAGATIMAGYLDDPDATRAAFAGGWLRTGDNVRVDADGFVHFVDRARDMIKRAGENVSAGEVESVVNSHPAVFESAAIGVPDEMRDEAIKLFVVARGELSETELLAWCEARLARFKVPSAVEFVDALPRTSVGKIRKEALRRRARGL